jgi:5-bromo-4-chloroindolyl phosphate hydrolysis protein
MGRYYSGDLEGKWFFGLQCSTTPDKFGAVEHEPYMIEYTIYRENLDVTKKKMTELETELGENLQKIDEFFEVNNGYNDQKLIDAGIDPKLLGAYADWFFGKKVLDFFEANPDADECNIDSEL